MARLGTKRPMSVTTTSEAARLLDRLSKAALIDLYTCALARLEVGGDIPPTVAQIAQDAEPMLRMRGDRSPFPVEENER